MNGKHTRQSLIARDSQSLRIETEVTLMITLIILC